MKRFALPPRAVAWVAATLASALLAACATAYGPVALQPGDSTSAALQQMGPPSAEHRRADGGLRLEYARGPFGKQTYMLDFDAQGRLLQWQQVLNENQFNTIRAGMTLAELQYSLGRPVRVWAVRYHDQTVYSYRYDTTFCQLFHVGITPAGIVEDTSYGPDPLCERRERPGF